MNQTQQQQPMAFTDAHNAVYNGLRDTLQRYVAQGVPGMDKVVDALNKQHTANMANYQPTQTRRPMAATQMPQNPSQVQQNQVGQLNNLMTQIRQKNAPALPNGYGSYAA